MSITTSTDVDEEEFVIDTAHQAVAIGAAWLDQVRPTWPNEIDLDIFDLGSPTNCVLGQVALAVAREIGLSTQMWSDRIEDDNGETWSGYGILTDGSGDFASHLTCVRKMLGVTDDGDCPVEGESWSTMGFNSFDCEDPDTGIWSYIGYGVLDDAWQEAIAERRTA